jgi:hypothetical protein
VIRNARSYCIGISLRRRVPDHSCSNYKQPGAMAPTDLVTSKREKQNILLSDGDEIIKHLIDTSRGSSV